MEENSQQQTWACLTYIKCKQGFIFPVVQNYQAKQ